MKPTCPPAARRLFGVGRPLRHLTAALTATLLLTACGAGDAADGAAEATPGSPADAAPDPTPDATLDGPAPEADARPADATPAPVPPALAGRCDYGNPFSQAPECKGYTGAGWTAESAAADCQAPLPGAVGEFVAGESCGFDAELGRCEVGDAAATGYLLVMSGDDPTRCASARVACETFAGGTFAGSAVCDAPPDGPPPPSAVRAFVPPHLDCRDPAPGDPPGDGPNGQVCTWTAISACTQPGRRYEDYASCDDVRTQRPNYPVAPTRSGEADDPRLGDPAYMAELGWVTEQVAACACACCHTDRASKSGASDWNIEAGPIWLDTVADTGLAILIGRSDSTAFGAFPPDQNFGFSRDQTGLPTTDVERMQRFLLGEWTRRGYTEADFEGLPAFGGPLVAQARYERQPCVRGEGVDAEGMVRWVAGNARYVYILEEDSANPGVPPNLDLPEGTVWRLDVPPEGRPLATGIPYGSVPEGAVQRFPAEGPPAALVPGRTYSIYTLLDVGLPLSRCQFTAP